MKRIKSDYYVVKYVNINDRDGFKKVNVRDEGQRWNGERGGE